MITSFTTWQVTDIGGQRALIRSVGGATMAFALGPPFAAPDGRDRLAAALASLGPGIRGAACCRQVHGRTVHRVETLGAFVVEIGDGDGLVTTREGVGLAIWTADCVPVLIAGDGLVAAVHAGWRGCAADIVGAVVTELERRPGGTAAKLSVALGPAVCGACYEVGDEVLDALSAVLPDQSLWRCGARVDLRAFVRARCESLGVAVDRIDSVGGCTVESPALASYRRDGAAAGRQWSMVVLEG